MFLGLGLPTLSPTNGTAAIQVANVPGVRVAGFLIQGWVGTHGSATRVGDGAYAGDASNPGSLHDVFMRVGGSTVPTNAQDHVEDQLGDNLWLWRADRVEGGGWTTDGNLPCDIAIVVNGDDVEMSLLHHCRSETQDVDTSASHVRVPLVRQLCISANQRFRRALATCPRPNPALLVSCCPLIPTNQGDEPNRTGQRGDHLSHTQKVSQYSWQFLQYSWTMPPHPRQDHKTAVAPDQTIVVGINIGQQVVDRGDRDESTFLMMYETSRVNGTFHQLAGSLVLVSGHVDKAQRLHPLLLLQANAEHDTYRNAVGSMCDSHEAGDRWHSGPMGTIQEARWLKG